MRDAGRHASRGSFLLVAIILLLAILPGADGGIVYGTVTDAKTGAPIDGAKVELWTKGNASSSSTATLLAVTTTDANGSYNITDVDEGSYDVRVSAPGYHSLVLPVTLAANDSAFDASPAAGLNSLSDDAAKTKPRAGAPPNDVVLHAAGASGLCGAATALFGLIALVFVGTIMFARIHRNNLLQHALRQRIFEFIKNHPGKHYRALLRELDLPMGVLTHHLNTLEREELVTSYQDGIRRRFFPAGTRAEISFMLTDVQQQIVVAINAKSGISQADIAEMIRVSRPLVNYHIKILRDAGMVRIEPRGRETACFLVNGTTPPTLVPSVG